MIKITVTGRLTRNAESRVFADGGKVTKLAIADNRKIKKNGEWVDKPIYLDAKGFNSTYPLADILEKCFGKNGKGRRICVHGDLDIEEWDDKDTGVRRSKPIVKIVSFEFLDNKPGDAETSSSAAAVVASRPSKTTSPAREVRIPDEEDGDEVMAGAGAGAGSGDIPF